MDIQEAKEESTRTVAQIGIRMIFVLVFSAAIYAQLIVLILAPIKKNLFIIRLLIYILLPALVVAHLLSNLAEVLIKKLTDPNAVPFKSTTIARYVEAIIGMYATRMDDEGNPSQMEGVRLLQLNNEVDVRRGRKPWTWKRFGQLVFAILVLAQAVGTITLWVRRCNRSACLGVDARLMWAAVGSSVSSIASVILLALGHTWEIDHDAEVRTSVGPLTRLALETLVAALIQESFSRAGRYRCMQEYYGSMAEALGTGLDRLRFMEVVELAVITVLFIAFKDEISKRTNVKLFTVIGVILVVIACFWISVDALAVLGEDIGQLVDFGYWQGGGANWQDPISNYIPFI